MSDLQENEASLKKVVEQLEGIESVRTSLIKQLREAIKEQVYIVLLFLTRK